MNSSTSNSSGSTWWHWLVIIGGFLLVANFSTVRDSFSAPIAYDAAVAGEVVLYGTTWCGYCKKARALLDRHNIPYQDLDVEKSASAQAAFQKIGGRGVPVITVGNKAMHGFDYSRLRKLLECADC